MAVQKHLCESLASEKYIQGLLVRPCYQKSEANNVFGFFNSSPNIAVDPEWSSMNTAPPQLPTEPGPINPKLEWLQEAWVSCLQGLTATPQTTIR